MDCLMLVRLVWTDFPYQKFKSVTDPAQNMSSTRPRKESRSETIPTLHHHPALTAHKLLFETDLMSVLTWLDRITPSQRRNRPYWTHIQGLE